MFPGKPLAASYVLVLAAFAGIVLLAQPPGVTYPAGTAPAFDAARAMGELRELNALTGAAGGRTPGGPGQQAVILHTANALRAAGLSTHLEIFQDRLGGELTNIVAEIPGDLPEVVVLGAHHDASTPGPAVVDGLAGLATLIESARALGAAAAADTSGIRRTIVLAAFDGESFGCAGSTEFAKQWTIDASRPVRAAISLDSIGWKDGQPVLHSPRYEDRWGRSHRSPDWLAWSVIRSGARAGVSAPLGDAHLSLAYQAAVRLVDLGYFSDDRSFVLQDVPSVFIADFSLLNFYPHYDTDQDTIDQVSVESLGQAGTLATAGIWDLARVPHLPAGEADYLLVPSPFGWARLTEDHLRLLGALAVLPGLIALSAAGSLRRAPLLLPGWIALAALFLFGLLALDPIVFSVVAGPPILAAPLLSAGSRAGAWVFAASLTASLLVPVILLPVVNAGYGSQILISSLALGVLFASSVIGILMLAARLGAARRARASGPGGAALAGLPPSIQAGKAGV